MLDAGLDFLPFFLQKKGSCERPATVKITSVINIEGTVVIIM